MGAYGKTLPVTGMTVLTIGTAEVTTPLIALAGAAAIIGGFLLLRLIRPAKARS